MSTPGSTRPRELSFVKMNPSGNTTLLITDAVPREHHLSLARTLIPPLYLSVDQVGYVEPPRDPRAAARLQMMGGEFCGNATRALAAYLAEQSTAGTSTAGTSTAGTDTADAVRLLLEVSGSETLVEVLVQPRGDGSWWTEAEVPLPLSLREETIPLGARDVAATRVTFPGIEHIVLPDIPPSLEVYRTLLEGGWFHPEVEAQGVMFYQPATEELTPLVAVDRGEPIWEGSCGSGSVAVAAARAYRDRRSVPDLSLRQPGGTLIVSVDYTRAESDALRGNADAPKRVESHGRITRAVIKGTVEKIASGRVVVPTEGESSE